MKYLQYLLTLLLLPAATVLYGQPPAETDSLEPWAYGQPEKTRPYVWAEAAFGVLTNSVHTTSLLQFGTKDFLEQEDKEALAAPVGSFLRYGLAREVSVGYREPWYRVLDTYKMGKGISLRNTYFNSAKLSGDLLNLALFGNKPYTGETLSLDGSSYETWYYSSLDYHFDVLFDSVQPVSFSVSLHVGHDHNYYNMERGQLYTDPEGAYLDMNLDYSLRENAIDAHPFAGLGVGIGAQTAFRLNEREKLVVQIKDFGIMNWGRMKQLQTDSSFRFSGLRFENIFAINDSLTRKMDEDYTEAFFYQGEDPYFALLPFYAKASYHRKLEGTFRELSVQADYRYLTGYYPRISVGTAIKTGYKQSLMASASTGGYTWFSLNAGYEIAFADYWSLKAKIMNLNGLVLPNLFGGAVGSISLSYEL